MVAHVARAACKCTYMLLTPKHHSSEIIGKARDIQLSGPLSPPLLSSSDVFLHGLGEKAGNPFGALVSRQRLACLPSFDDLQLVRWLSD